MHCVRNYVISMTALAGLWGNSAQADEQPPPDPEPALPGDTDAAAPVDAVPETPAPPPAVSTPAGEAARPPDTLPGEAIEIFDERPDKPFDRDTEIRLTGAELAARGATDLATALALLPDVTVRDAGRGGFNIDIRGARKGAVGILVDGVLVTDPYYGTFDVSTIPVTDIVQIRVATTPQSPIDGPGGPGGVIEVHTRDAIGPQLMIGRLTADSAPGVGASGTTRIALGKSLALRLSLSGLGGARDLELMGDAAIDEERYAATGAARLEYRKGDRRVAVDGFLDDRHYIAPPSDTMRSTILLIDRETTARASIKADERIGQLQLQAQAWTHFLERQSRTFLDPQLTTQNGVEFLKALRSGATALATRPFLRDFRWAGSVTVDFEKAALSTAEVQDRRGHTTIVEAAGDLQYERGRLRADVAAGIALPFGVDADPWPELKAVAKYRPLRDLELTATAAYKGRLPSLRERFDADNGNPAIGPERIAHGEVRAIEHINDLVHLEVAPYVKRSNGTIRTSPDAADMGLLVNLGRVDFWGVDTQARVTPHAMVEAGAGYAYVRAHSDDPMLGDEPIERLPRHRWDAWAQVLPGGRFSGRARVKYVGAASDKGTRVGGYALVEANLTAQITKQYLGVLRVDDVLDERPETRAGYHGAGRVISLIMQGTWE